MALFSGKSKSNQRVRRSRNGYEREYSEEEYEIHIQRVRRRRTLRLALIFIVLIIAALQSGKQIKTKLEDDILPDLSEKTQEAIRKQQRRRWERKHGVHEK